MNDKTLVERSRPALKQDHAQDCPMRSADCTCGHDDRIWNIARISLDRIEALEAALRDAAKAERDRLDAAYLEAFAVHMGLVVTNWPKIKHVPTAIALAAKTMDAMVSFQTLRELPDDVVNAVKEAAKEHTDDVDIDWQEIITALADALESKP